MRRASLILRFHELAIHMLDFDAGKLLIIGVVALVVIGPKDLPRVLRQVGQMVGRLRRMAGEFQGQFVEAMKEADLQDLQAEVAKLKDSATLDVDFDPARDVKTQLTDAVNGSNPTIGPYSQPSMPSPSGSDAFRLPARSEIDVKTDADAAGGTGTADLVLDSSSPVLHPVIETAEADPPTRRKILIRRRRFGSGPDDPLGRGPAPTRPRHILPARRETADQ